MWPVWMGPAPDPTPIVAQDGERLARQGAVRFALVGGYAQAPPSLDQDLRQAQVDFVVLVGDAVSHGTSGAYRDLTQRLAGLPVCPLPGEGERSRDPGLRRFRQTWEGLGVRGLQEPVTWRAFFLETERHPWRMVVLDADREALGSRFFDEQFWLPKVVSEGDEPLIVLMNAPLDPLVATAPPDRGALQLHSALRRHVSGSRVALVAATGGAPSLTLPGGTWGEAWASVGQVGGTPVTLHREAGELALEPGLDEALSSWLTDRGADPVLLDAGVDYEASRWPLLGWWLVTLQGPELSLELRLAHNDVWRTVYRTSWTREGGWKQSEQPGSE
jgi:hypothetical protein